MDRFKNLRKSNYERVANYSLMVLMGIVTTLTFLDLVRNVFLEVASSPFFLIKVERLPDILGLFL